MQKDRTPRAATRPKKRKGAWYARGFVPVRIGGTIARKRIERAAGSDCKTKAECQTFCDQLNRMFEERATSTRRTLTFAKAMDNYLALGKPVPKYAEKLAAHFGEMLCNEIDNTTMLDATRVLFPSGSGAPNINRHLYTPVIAILRFAAMDKACDKPSFVRPAGYDEHPEIECPKDDSWYPAVFRELAPDPRAISAFLTVHGRRVGELLTRKPTDFDPAAGTLYLGKTKNGCDVFIRLEPSVLALMLQMPMWQTRERLFGYPEGVTGSNAVNLAIKRACKRAGVRYYSTHKMGRHRFALRLLDAGYSLQHVKDAGGWRTLKVLSDRYASRAHTEYTATIHQVGAEAMKFVDLGERVGKVIAAPTPLVP
jgi:hypothetical protein